MIYVTSLIFRGLTGRVYLRGIGRPSTCYRSSSITRYDILSNLVPWPEVVEMPFQNGRQLRAAL